MPKTKRPPQPCRNCDSTATAGGVCQSCGHDANPYEPKRHRIPDSTPLKHPYFNAREPHHVEISAWMYKHYGKSYQTWREELCKLGMLFDLPVTNGGEYPTNYGWQARDIPEVDVFEHELLKYLAHAPERPSVLDLVNDLPEPRRTVVYLWLEGVPHREVAKRYEWTDGHARNMLSLALSQVRKIYFEKT